MRKAALLTIANFGSAFAALQFYNQCGGGAYTGDTTCPSGSTCVEATKWYSQCIPDAKAGPSPKAAAVEKSDVDLPSFGFPEFPEAPGSGSGNQNGGENDENASLTPIVSAPAEEADESSKKPVETPIDGPVANPTEAPVATPDAGSGSGSGAGGISRTIPASSGASAAATAIPVSGEFDGKMTYYDRSPAVCQDQVETGEADAMFILEDGATLRNVIIGPGQAEGVHCKGTCTLENVWFEDVCEDAITLKQKSGTSTIRGGGAFHAADKVVQFNGRGTVEISDFYVEDYGKLVRSCGNCKDNGGPRNVVIDNVAAVNGGVLCGINTNYGDTCTVSNACQDSGKNCDLFEGNSDGSEPSKLSSGPDGTSCRADNFSETC
ncbi:hypothetical protein FOMA001_g8250 [Fusarium oxysporum f. sp. matthiolae]|nr:hypothetical protein FOMA001_g8250 [Fusarium oxysporum f. sp. matthiolae]